MNDYDEEPPSEFLGCLLATILGATVALALVGVLWLFGEGA
jgi:hypothetical protein